MVYEPLYHDLRKWRAYARFFWAFLFLLWSSFLYFGGVFNWTIIPLALVGYEMIIANSIISYPTRAHGIVVNYYMATIARALWLVAERVLFSCNDRALWNFFSNRRLFWVVSKTTCAWAKTTKNMTKYNYIFNNWKKNQHTDTSLVWATKNAIARASGCGKLLPVFLFYSF